RYEQVDGTDVERVVEVSAELAAWVRARRRPALLHLRCVRYGGHAGTDVEAAYRAPEELRAELDHDPILGTARTLVRRRVMSAAEVLDRYVAVGERVRATAEALLDRPPLRSLPEIVAPLAPRRPVAVASAVAALPPPPDESVTLAQAIGRTLGDLLAAHPE